MIDMVDGMPISSQTPFTPCGLVVTGEPTFEECLSYGEVIKNADKSVHFWIGDWLNYIEATYGEKRYEEAILRWGYEHDTIRKDRYVASRVEFGRRRPNLSFGHHVEVAPYESDEQDMLLDKAIEFSLSVMKLRERKDLLLHPPKIIEPGQVWQLGQHLLYCGDSASGYFVDLATKSTPSFAFADPPYNAGVAEWDKDFQWQHDYLSTIAPIVAVTPGISAIKDFMRVNAMPYKWSMSYWINNGMTRGAMGFGNWIYVALFTEGSLYRNEQDQENIEDGDEWDKQTISIIGNDHSDLKHKGRKPIRMLRHIINLFAKEGETVIDPFLGTGTTLAACEETGRCCVGAEISPEYCGSIIQRWEKLTGKKAEETTHVHTIR